MAVGVVDELEIVQIQNGEGKRNAVADQPLGEPQDMAPGHKPGELVQHVFQLGFRQYIGKIRILFQLLSGIHGASIPAPRPD